MAERMAGKGGNRYGDDRRGEGSGHYSRGDRGDHRHSNLGKRDHGGHR